MGVSIFSTASTINCKWTNCSTDFASGSSHFYGFHIGMHHKTILLEKTWTPTKQTYSYGLNCMDRGPIRKSCNGNAYSGFLKFIIMAYGLVIRWILQSFPTVKCMFSYKHCHCISASHKSQLQWSRPSKLANTNRNICNSDIQFISPRFWIHEGSVRSIDLATIIINLPSFKRSENSSPRYSIWAESSWANLLISSMISMRIVVIFASNLRTSWWRISFLIFWMELRLLCNWYIVCWARPSSILTEDLSPDFSY